MTPNRKTGWVEESHVQYEDPLSNHLRSTDLKTYSLAPIHYEHARKMRAAGDEEEKDAFTFGNLFHAMFDPKIKILVPPEVDGRTKEGKAILAAFLEGAEPELNEFTMIAPKTSKKSGAANYDLAKAMHDAVVAHPRCRGILADPYARHELSGYVHDDTIIPNTDRPFGLLRARYDLIIMDGPQSPVIVDWKSATAADPESFEKAIWNYRYDLQAAHYRRVAHLLTGLEFRFIFAVVENKPPHAVGFYETSEEMDRLADLEWEELAGALRFSEAHGAFPSYNSNQIARCNLPFWAANRLMAKYGLKEM